MSKKANRPAWFKVFGHLKPLMDSMPDEVVGRAFKAVLQYFETGEIVELQQMEYSIFCTMKPHVDESFDDFENKQKQMTYIRWKGSHPNGTAEEFEAYYSNRAQSHDA